MAVVPEEDVPVSQAAPSEEGSLYEPPPTDEEVSAGYQSFGDTDSLGSLGDLEEWGAHLRAPEEDMEVSSNAPSCPLNDVHHKKGPPDYLLQQQF